MEDDDDYLTGSTYAHARPRGLEMLIAGYFEVRAASKRG